MAGAAIASAALEEAGIVPLEVGIGGDPEAIMSADLVVPDPVSDRVVAPGLLFAPVAVRDPAVAPTLAAVLDLVAVLDLAAVLGLAAASPADR